MIIKTDSIKQAKIAGSHQRKAKRNYGKRIYRDPEGESALLRPMQGTPDNLQYRPGFDRGNRAIDGSIPMPGPVIRSHDALMLAVIRNTPVGDLYGTPNRQGFRDYLIEIKRITGQTPALLQSYRDSVCKYNRVANMHAREHMRGIELGLRKQRDQGKSMGYTSNGA